MGNYSYIVESDLRYKTNEKDFLKKYYTLMVSCVLFNSSNEEEYNTFKKSIEQKLDESDLQDIQERIVAFKICDYHKISSYLFRSFQIEELTLDIDGWKIQGYWYNDFCVWLHYLYLCGLRGDIKMNEEQNQDFIIHFTDEGVIVDIYEMLGYKDIPNDDGIENFDCITIEPEEPYLPICSFSILEQTGIVNLPDMEN